MKNVGLLFVLAMATVALVAQATAQVGTGKTDILGQGIFETKGGAFAMNGDTNIDQVKVGSDQSQAFSWGIYGIGIVGGPYGYPGPRATNNLEIKKNQDSGACACCQVDANTPCKDCCTKTNVETIDVGNRFTLAAGYDAQATNNIKIVTNQA